jgi:hypothetical protein
MALGVGLSYLLHSVNIVSDHRLDNRANRVRSPAEAKDSSSCFYDQTSPEAHPVSHPMGIEGQFHGVKRGRVVTLTNHPT